MRRDCINAKFYARFSPAVLFFFCFYALGQQQKLANFWLWVRAKHQQPPKKQQQSPFVVRCIIIKKSDVKVSWYRFLLLLITRKERRTRRVTLSLAVFQDCCLLVGFGGEKCNNFTYFAQLRHTNTQTTAANWFGDKLAFVFVVAQTHGRKLRQACEFQAQRATTRSDWFSPTNSRLAAWA